MVVCGVYLVLKCDQFDKGINLTREYIGFLFTGFTSGFPSWNLEESSPLMSCLM